MRQVVIRAGGVAIRAQVLETPTAENIWKALPISSEAKTWGEEVYFDAPISCSSEPDARAVVEAGEIVYWPEGAAIAIGFGPTPISQNGEIRLVSPCNIWAKAIDDVRQLKCVHAGEPIEIIPDTKD